MINPAIMRIETLGIGVLLPIVSARKPTMNSRPRVIRVRADTDIKFPLLYLS